MKKLLWLCCIAMSQSILAQNVGIHTTNPQTSLDVRGNLHLGGASKFMSYDTASGRIVWNNSNLFVPTTQYLIRHSASSEGLYYNNAQLSYVNATGNPVFFTNWNTGNSFIRRLGINNSNPQYPLSFNSDAGDKISFWSNGTGTHYGIGIQNGYMQIYAKESTDIIAFGFGSSNFFNELVHINGNSTLQVFRGDAAGGTAEFYGADNITHINFGPNEDTYIRAGRNGRNVILNDIVGGRVGVGTDSPTEMLDVNGVIRAQQYKYSTPKTSYCSINPTAFSSMDGTFNVTRLANYGAFLNAVTGVPLVAPVNLPHNARIIRFTAHYYDNSTSQDLSIRLNSIHVSNIRIFLADITSSGNPGSSSSSHTMNQVVDNQQYSYHIEVVPAGGWQGNPNLQVIKITIEYTLDEPI